MTSMNMDNFKVNLPYPPIKVESKNSKYANLILQNYSGMVSEFTAVTQYIYHEIYAFHDNTEVSLTIKGIAMIEMMHLQMLGEIVTLLGCSPKYGINRKGKFLDWTPKFIDYGKTLPAMILDDIVAEEKAIDQYIQTLALIDDKYIKAIIERIIMDEELHLKLFSNLYEKLI